MPQRAMSSLLVLVGFVLALALVVVGADLVRSAGRGPRWKQRLLGAGLGLVSALGLLPADSAKAQIPLGVTCYDVAYVEPPAPPTTPAEVKQALERLTAQVQLLKKFAAEEKLDKEVVKKAVTTAEADLAVLDREGALKTLTSDTEKHAAAMTLNAARTAVDALRLRLAPPAALADTVQWKRLLAAWKEAEGAVARKDPLDINDKQRLLVALENAQTDLDALQQSGLLSKEEATLLAISTGFSGLLDAVHEKAASGKLEPATPTFIEPVCYGAPLPVTLGQVSLSQLRTRLPFLEKLAADEKLHPAAVEKVLQTVEANLKKLSDNRATLMNGKEKEEAAAAEAAAKAAVEKIRAKLKAVAAPAKEK